MADQAGADAGPGPAGALAGFGGLTMIAALCAAIFHELTGASGYALAGGLSAVCGVAAFWPGIAWSRRAFVLIGLALVALSAATQPDWAAATSAAIRRAGFIAAFYTATTSMRAAAMGSEAIIGCGRFLSAQPPGRRYAALTTGGHLFGLVLSYGAIALLGALAREASGREPDAEIRRHRIRRMLVAIQRGFVATLVWSPLAFASAITLTLVPGSSWAQTLPYSIVSALLLAGIGWALDTCLKPRVSAPLPPPRAAEGGWVRNLWPLLALLAVIVAAIAVTHVITGLRIIGSVMLIVPVIALIWAAFQTGGGAPAMGHLRRAAARSGDFALRDLPRQRSEIVLLVMAAFIGTMGGHLAAPAVAASGVDLAGLPAPLLLLTLLWIIPLTGQIGMNPILSVALLAPILPAPAELGVSPAVVIVALTSGWALSGATSPFTASTLLIGFYGDIPARRVGQVWNGPYALICGAALSLWIVALSLIVTT